VVQYRRPLRAVTPTPGITAKHHAQNATALGPGRGGSGASGPGDVDPPGSASRRLRCW
jgi:hypothetical protein